MITKGRLVNSLPFLAVEKVCGNQLEFSICRVKGHFPHIGG